MIDRTFTAILVFALMAFASATIASLMFVAPTSSFPVAARHVQLERVVITARRQAVDTVAETEAVVPSTSSVQ